MTRTAALSLFCGLLTLGSGTGQEPLPATPTIPIGPPTAPKAQRAIFVVKNANPSTLAEVVGTHYKGEATVIAAPPGSGNAVLISGAPGVVPEVVKLLEQLDRKPRTVEVEVTIAEVPAKDWKESETRTDDLAKTGQRIKLTAVEGQLVSTQSGGSKPVITSSAVAGGGFGGRGGAPPMVQKSVSYQDIGTTTKMTARVGSDDVIALELSVNHSQVRGADGDEPPAPAYEHASLATKLSVPPGKSVVARAVRTEGKNGATVAVVLVTARVVPDAPPNPK